MLLQLCDFSGLSVAQVEVFTVSFRVLQLCCDDLIMMCWWIRGLQGTVPPGGCVDIQRKAWGSKSTPAPLLYSQFPPLFSLSAGAQTSSSSIPFQWSKQQLRVLQWVGAIEDDRRPINKTQTCLFCAVLSKGCISNEVIAVCYFCLLINGIFLLPVLFLAREVTGKWEEKDANWADLGSVCFTVVLI